MMTYGGIMNSFDEASFLMQSSGLEGGAHVCLCGSCCQLAQGYFSSSPDLAENCVCLCVRAWVWLHRSLYCIPLSHWINSVNPFKHSCTWFILSLWGCRDHPTVVHCSQGSSPFGPVDPNTHILHTYCIIIHIIDIHHTSVTVYPSMVQAAKSRVKSVYISALWSIYKSFLSQGWWYLWAANGDARFSMSIFIKVSAPFPGLNHIETLDMSASSMISHFCRKPISMLPS